MGTEDELRRGGQAAVALVGVAAARAKDIAEQLLGPRSKLREDAKTKAEVLVEEGKHAAAEVISALRREASVIIEDLQQLEKTLRGRGAPGGGQPRGPGAPSTSAPAKKAPAAKKAASSRKATSSKKAAPVKKVAPTKRAVPAKKVATAKVASSKRAAAVKKAAPAKRASPAKKAAATKKTTATRRPAGRG